MEIIQLAGYSEEEKVHIARKYLLPRQMTEHGLPDATMQVPDETLRLVISEYTREAGVRNLERQLGALARKVAARVATTPLDSPVPPPTVIEPSDVERYLGPARFKKEMAFRTSRPGVATGLAWTETGGDVLLSKPPCFPAGTRTLS